jgi:hypothetical protein
MVLKKEALMKLDVTGPSTRCHVCHDWSIDSDVLCILEGKLSTPTVLLARC